MGTLRIKGAIAACLLAAVQLQGVAYQDVLPVLEKHCLECHGEKKQKSGYRLDDAETALRGGELHAPNIIPGRPDESPLLKFVSSEDPDERMPPKGPRLTAEEKALIRSWIAEGAKFPQSDSGRKETWWSLAPVVRPALPPVGASGSAHPVDRFIDAKLAESGLRPSGDADARTVLRRMHFDLTGLPPTPDDARGFEAETARIGLPAAVAALADRLLASPQYGERWARHWLDVARYGETHGYDKDKPRPNAWHYRDYVIRSLNADKPWSRFVAEQLAGDTLYPDTLDGITGQGFLAAGPWDFIGHAELPETKTDGKIARVLDRDDMVSNALNAFCGVTAQCARCHDHKFDPVKQTDYYRLQAVFAAIDKADRTFDLEPEAAKKRRELTGRREALDAERSQLEAAVNLTESRRGVLLGTLIEELKQGEAAVERLEFGYHSRISPKQDGTKWVQVDLGTARELATVELAGCHDTYNGIGAGFGFPVRFRLEASDDATFKQGVTPLLDRTGEDFANPGVTPVRIATSVKARYLRLTATKLALRSKDYILAIGELRAFDPKGRNVALGAAVTAADSIEAPPRWKRENLTDGYFYARKGPRDDALIAALERERAEIRKGNPKIDQAKLTRLSAVQKERGEVSKAITALPKPITAYVATVHTGKGAFAGTGAKGGKPRTINLLRRGDVNQPGPEMGPGAPGFVPGIPEAFDLPADAPEGARRAALVSWITSKDNPLTWRVAVNRVWHYHFGRGLVDTPGDFGKMGGRPSHPALLDWLAAEFRDSGGSLKSLHRLILTSAAYRRSSLDVPAYSARDADNRLLWRMNRRKLEAEAVRDGILAVAGKLDLTMGGPSFMDFVIDKPQHSPHYLYEKADVEDPATHRRSVYRFVVRSQPQPFLTVLDCADPSMSVDHATRR